MKEFQETIKAYLDRRAQEDALFAEHYAREGKSIEKCCNYIINQARKKGGSAVCMPDDEVYGLAVHYYDEDIPADECKPVRGSRPAVPKVELTEEEKAAAKEEALELYRKGQVEAFKQKERDKKRQEAQKQRERAEIFESKQLSLFDL